MSNQNMHLKVSQLKHENYILQQQVESKFFQMQLLLDHLPVVFMAINKDLIFELVQGNGLKVIQANELVILGQVLEDIYQGEKLEELIQNAFEGHTDKAIIELKSGYYFHCTFTPQSIDSTIERVFIIANYINLADKYKDLSVIEEHLF